MKHIEKAWQGYEQMVCGPNVPQEVRDHLRRAFCAGAAVTFTIMTRGVSGMDEGSEPTEADMQLMTALQAEVDEFGQRLDLEVLAQRVPPERRGRG